MLMLPLARPDPTPESLHIRSIPRDQEALKGYWCCRRTSESFRCPGEHLHHHPGFELSEGDLEPQRIFRPVVQDRQPHILVLGLSRRLDLLGSASILQAPADERAEGTAVALVERPPHRFELDDCVPRVIVPGDTADREEDAKVDLAAHRAQVPRVILVEHHRRGRRDKPLLVLLFAVLVGVGVQLPLAVHEMVVLELAKSLTHRLEDRVVVLLLLFYLDILLLPLVLGLHPHIDVGPLLVRHRVLAVRDLFLFLLFLPARISRV